MNKLIATLALALGISGAALADDYFTNMNEALDGVPVSHTQAYDGQALDWTFSPSPVPTASGAGFASHEEASDRHSG